MSGAAGGVIINKEDLKATIRDYRETVLKPLNLDKSYNITGVRRRPEKNTFGDIDIVLSFPGGDKKQLKKDFAQHLEQIDKIPSIPRKKNKKYFIHGSIVTNLYPIVGKPDQYVQIDNIITPSEDEGKFTYNMLDLPAQEQGLTLGLAKAIFTELNPAQIEQLFKDLNIPQNIEKPKEGEEYDFNLNTSGLSLKIAPIGKSFGREIWKSSSFNDTKTLLKSLGVDIENDKFRDIIKVVKNFKSRRSIDRLKGMFAKNIRVSDTEVGRDKGIKKQQALDKVASLEEKFNPLVMSLISPLILENEEKPKIAIFPGKFKPPHKDHLARIIAASKFVGPLGTVKVIISPKSTKEDPNQETITAEQSLSVFNLYKSKGIIPDNVKIEISQYPSPVVSAYKEFETNKDKPQEEQQPYIAVFGKNETKRYAGVLKIPNITINDFPEAEVGNESATNVRTALKNGDDITRFLPNGINPKEYKEALGLNSPLNESIKIDMSKVNKALLKGIGKEDETDENILALIDSHPQGKIPHTTFLNFYAKFDKYFGEEDDNRILDKIGLEHILVDVLKLSPEKIKIIMNDYQKGNRDLEDIKWFEKYDTTHQKDEEWNPAGGEKFDDAQDNIATVNQYLSKNKKLHESDPKKGTGKKPKGSSRRLYTDENPKDTVKIKFSTRQDIIDTLSKTSFKSKPHARQSQIINLIHQRVRAALGRTKDPQKKAKLRSAFEYIKKRKEASKKKTQSLKKQKTNEAIDNSFDKVKFYHDYYTNLSPSTFEIILEENDIRISNITDPDPSLPTPENIRQIPVNQNLEENDPEDGSATPYGSGYNKLDEAIVGNSIVCDNCGWSWKIADGGDDLFICHKCGHDNTPLNEAKPYKHKHGFDDKLGKDPFGLNQFAREIMQEEESFDTFDYPKHIKSLTKFMLDKGMKLRPLPTVKFINDDAENAKDFFGKTAYYDPNNHRVVLYTLNRHPKDVMRSFAHEMIHHMQNYEGKLQSIHTQNTNEEGDLPEIEREAYEKGNMTFRSWTDTLTEGILKEGRYDTLSNQISRDIFNFWKQDFDEGAKDSTYEDNYDFPSNGIQVKAQITYKPGFKKLKVDGGSDIASETLPGYLEVNFIVDPKMLPEFWEEISMNLKDVVRHEIEHITQSGDSKTKNEKFDEEFDEAVRILVKADIIPQVEYFKLPKEVDANLQGMYFRAKKEKRPFGNVINTYLDAQDITPKEKQIVLNLWRSRRGALSLPKF